MMNWRGTWLPTEQYLKNDVVISPLNGSSYILIETSLLDGSDPSVNAEWAELAPAATGISQINAGAGINVTNPTGPIVTVSNDGVISVINGVGISIDNSDPQQPVVSSTALQGVTQGLGISVSGLVFSPTITNTGVRTLAVGAGLISNQDPNNPSIGTTAVLSIAQGNGISVTGGQTAVITNTGVVSVSSSGVGISVNNTDPRNPILTNTGVLSIVAGDNISVTAGVNPTVNALVSQLTSITTITSNIDPVPPAGLSSFVVSSSANIFFDYILNGAPDTYGTFIIDLTSINMFLSGGLNVVAGDKITIYLTDTVTTSPVDINFAIGEIVMNDTSTPPTAYPFQIRPSFYAIEVAALRATGFRVPSLIDFSNDTSAATLELTSWSNLLTNTVYYPNGFV
nr:MAG: hypothetical protein [Lake Baikal virophage 11]